MAGIPDDEDGDKEDPDHDDGSEDGTDDEEGAQNETRIAIEMGEPGQFIDRWETGWLTKKGGL